MEKTKDQILRDAMRHMGKPIDEITRRMTYRARSPGVKPTTGIKLILPKTSSMAEKIQKVLDGDDPKKLKQMNNLVIGREDDGKEISLEFKTSASREKFRKMMNESVELDEMKKSDGPFTVVAIKNNKVVGQLRNVEHYDIEVAIDMMRKDKQGAKISVESKKGKVVHTEDVELDESVKIMFKGFDMEQRVFTAKLKKFGFDKQYRKMMQNFMKHANSGDGFYFIDGSRQHGAIGFEVHPVSDMMMGPKIKKLGDKQDLGGGKTATLIAIKEDVQLDEGTLYFVFDNAMKAGAFARRVMRDKLASEVDRYVDFAKRKEVVEVITHPDLYSHKKMGELAKRYKGEFDSTDQGKEVEKLMRETNFRFPQAGEDYGEFGMSINDPDSFSGSGPSRSELRKRSRDIERKFASVMRKHKRTKVGEVLDLLDKDGGTKLYKDSDIKQIGKYLTKFKDNVRKVAHQMLIDVMEGDDYLAKKRIPVKEDVQIKEAESLRWTSMKDTEKEELVRLAKVPARVTEMKWKEIPNPLKERLAKYINKSTKGEFALVEERSHTIVVDRKTGKTVYGPTDVADAKLYVKKQIQPNKFVIRQIRGGQIYR